MKNIYVCDCDHDSIDIEKNVLKNKSGEVKWLACKTEQDLIDQCQNAHGLLNQYAPFTEYVFKNLPNLKVVVRYGVGVNNIDIDAATKYKVQICNVPDYGVHEVADHAVSLSLALARKIVSTNENVKNNIWDFNQSVPIYRLQEQTVGVIGLGRIGSSYARKMHGLGTKVIGFDPLGWNDSIPDFIEEVSLEDLCKRADIISLHIPLTEQTQNLIGAKEFKLLKPSVYLINTARGGIVNEAELLQSLENKTIAGAGFDVLEKEPIDPNNPLLKLVNFLCTPHMAWHSEQSGQELKRKVAEEALRVVMGNLPSYPINKIN